jgi:hypothetical protein
MRPKKPALLSCRIEIAVTLDKRHRRIFSRQWLPVDAIIECPKTGLLYDLLSRCYA